MLLSIKRYAKNAYIYLEGQHKAQEFFIVKSGKIKIKRTNPILGETEEIKGTGYIFGIIQCITGIVIDESVEAHTDCEVFIIERHRIDEVFSQYDRVKMKIVSEYSEILRKLDSDLVKYDFFFGDYDRADKIFDIVDKFLFLKEKTKASHLLKSFLTENTYSELDKIRAEGLLKELPDVKIYPESNTICEHDFPAGTVLFTEYELSTNFYIIKSGRIRITKLKHDTEILMAVLGPGDVFGEMSILNDKPRNATAEAVEKSTCMVIHKSGISNLPVALFVKLLTLLSRRIWMVQQQLICYKLPDPIAKLYFLLTSKVKQAIPNRDDDEYEGTFTFKFPLKELFQMIDYEYHPRKKHEISDFLQDKNIQCLEDAIIVQNLEKLFAKNSYYFSKAARAYKSLLENI